MEKGIKKYSDNELDILLKLSESKGFMLLKDFHNDIVKEQEKINAERIDFTKNDIAEHGIRIGHKKAWLLDSDLKGIVGREIDRRRKEQNKVKLAKPK